MPIGLNIAKWGADGLKPLILNVQTDNSGASSNDQFTVALKTGETYNFTAKYDGQETPHSSTTDLVLTFPSGAGNYDVEIWPQDDGTGFPGFYYNNTNDDTKVTEILQWGDVKFTTFDSSFEGCSNLDISATAGTCNTDDVTTFNQAFNGCSSMVTPPTISSVDNATSVYQMFNACSSMTSFPVMDFSSSSVTAAGYVFNACTSLTGAAPSYDMSSFTSVNRFYYNCNGLTSIPYCDTGSVTTGSSLAQIFEKCSSVTTFGGLNFNSISGTAGGNHFTDCSSATTISTLDNMDNVTSGFTFNGLASMTSFPTIDVSGFTSLSNFFRNCESMVTAPSLTTTAATDMQYMFHDCYLLETVPVYDTAGVLNFNYTFERCYALESVPAWDYSDATTFLSTFNSAGLTSAPAMDLSSAVTLSGLFYACSDLTTCGTLTTSTSLTTLSSLFNGTGIIDAPTITVTSNVTSWNNMFENSYVETCPTYDTSAATNMANMFEDIYSSTLDVPAFDFSLVTTLRDFARGLTAGSRGARSLPTINAPLCTDVYFIGYTNPNLTSVGTLTFTGTTGTAALMFNGSTNLTGNITLTMGSGVTAMNSAFASTAITGLTLTGTSGVTNFANLCQNVTELVSVNLIDTSAATNTSLMFTQCTGLEGFIMPTFDLGAMTNGASMFSGYAMSTASWEALLVATEANNSNSSVTWDGGNATYNDPSSAATARAALIADHSWTITDGGSI